MTKDKYEFDDLLEIMQKLRKECPWDKQQTHDSLKKYVIEETYEVVEAIDRKDFESLDDELGDLLLQIVFHAQIGKENNEFSINDVINAICKKMINRHPHVFSYITADSAEKVLTNWEEIKKKEKGLKSNNEVLEDVSKYLPALMRCLKVQEKTAKWGDYSPKIDQIAQSIIKNVDNLSAKAYDCECELDIGRILFDVCSMAMLKNVNPELALSASINDFIKKQKAAE